MADIDLGISLRRAMGTSHLHSSYLNKEWHYTAAIFK